MEELREELKRVSSPASVIKGIHLKAGKEVDKSKEWVSGLCSGYRDLKDNVDNRKFLLQLIEIYKRICTEEINKLSVNL